MCLFKYGNNSTCLSEALSTLFYSDNNGTREIFGFKASSLLHCHAAHVALTKRRRQTEMPSENVIKVSWTYIKPCNKTTHILDRYTGVSTSSVYLCWGFHRQPIAKLLPSVKPWLEPPTTSDQSTAKPQEIYNVSVCCLASCSLCYFKWEISVVWDINHAGTRQHLLDTLIVLTLSCLWYFP